MMMMMMMVMVHTLAKKKKSDKQIGDAAMLHKAGNPTRPNEGYPFLVKRDLELPT